MRAGRGYLLIEMMVVIGLMAVAGGMTVGICHWSLAYLRSTELAGSQVAALDQALGQLRSDIWCASAMRKIDDETLSLEVNGQEIIWRLAGDNAITRSESGAVRAWETGAGDTSLAVDGATVRIKFAETRLSRGGMMSMVSELILLEGNHS